MIFNNEIVMEKYLGKTKEFTEIEKQFAILIPKIHKLFPPMFKSLILNGTPQSSNSNSVTKITESKENKKIEELFRKKFDLKKFSIVWYNSGKPNAFTTPGAFLFISKNKNSEGQYKNPKKSIYVMIDVKLLTYFDFTPDEMVAIILHEIGHNFYSSVYHTCDFLLSSYEMLISLQYHLKYDNPKLSKSVNNLIKIIKTTSVGASLLDVIGNLGWASAGISIGEKIKDSLGFIGTIIRDYNEYMMNIMGFLFPLNIYNAIMMIRLNPIQIVKSFFRSSLGYSSERFADNFVADHGYGVSMGTSLTKMDHPKYVLSKVAFDSSPIGASIIGLVTVPAKVITILTDPHPSTDKRIYQQLDRMKEDFKDKSLTPEFKKELSSQINYYENICKNYEADKDKKTKDGLIFAWLTRLIMEKIVGSISDFRELVWKLDPHSKA